ncbi:glycoside hydrolase family 6 protein [Amycolatopsis sp. NPDC021455]|uniref:glycoside hydrolase family 6 protein n=1 Tax=Amycolatopsis sp. NPDC021455 TaxID=3154901 RepID=UPI0033FFDFB8
MRRWTALGVGAGLVVLSACGPAGTAIDPPAPGRPFPLLQGTRGLYVDPDNPAALWLRTAPADPRAELIRTHIATRPAAHLVTAPTAEVAADVRRVASGAAGAHLLPVFLASPDRTGGCASDHHGWFAELAHGLGNTPALVVVQAGHACADRAQVLSDAVSTIRQATTATVLIDVSDAASPQDAAALLAPAGADGFAVNVGGYTPIDKATTTVNAIRAAAGRTGYTAVVDGSRNDVPVAGTCNPPGARAGQYMSLTPRQDDVQQLWLTTPGISDGSCGTAPSSRAGEFVPDLAAALAQQPT